MRLTTRLVAFLVLTLAALVAVSGYLEYRQERALIREGLTRDARVLGKALSSVLGKVWQQHGMRAALELIEDTNQEEGEISAHWIWLDAESEGPQAPGTPSRAAIDASLESEQAVEVSTGTELRLYTYLPVATGETRRGALALSQSTSSGVSQRASKILRRAAIQLAAMFLISALTIYIIGLRLIGRPLGQLMRKIDRIGRGDLSQPLRLRGDDELTQLADGLNNMCDRLAESQAKVAEETAAKIAAIDQARHAGRLRTVGQLASGVAHELGTPLNVVGGRAALIAEDKLDAEQVKASAKIISAQADRMTGIIRQLLVFARRDASAKRPVEVESAIRESLAMVQPIASKRNVAVALSCDTAAKTFTDCGPSALQQVLTNLVINAIQASQDGGTVHVEIRTELAVPPDDPNAAPKPYARVEVRDEGEGIAPDNIDHVFEPFFTTKDVGEGTGLGLSIVHGILSDHDGWITVASAIGKGSSFTFFLPVIAT